jgi:hypothetical protein
MDVGMTTVAPFAPLGTLQMKGVLETGNLAPLKPLVTVQGSGRLSANFVPAEPLTAA